MPMRRAPAIAALLALPALLLGAMCGWLAIAHGAWRLGPVVVHEDGRRRVNNLSGNQT